MNLSPRNKLLLTIAGAVVVAVALAAVLVLPQVSKLGSLESDLSAAEQEAQSASTLLEQRREVRNRAAATDARLMQLATSFPENPELTSAIIELQDLAYENGVELRSVAPGQPAPRGSHVAVPIDLTYWGNWRECVDFSQQLMNLNRQYRVVELSASLMQEIGSDQPQPEVELDPYAVFVTVKLEAYVIPASNGSTTTAPAAPAPAQ